MATANSINANSSGVQTFNSTTGVWSGSPVTNHGVILGAANNNLSSLAVAATGTVLAGVTASDAAFTASPSLTSVTFGAGTALSVYQEGTFTPGMDFGGGTTGITYGIQTGSYTRIGNMIFAYILIALTSKGTSVGTAHLTGLPFAVNGTYAPLGQLNSLGITLDANFYSQCVQFLPGTTTLSFNEQPINGSSAIPMNDTNFSNNATFYVSGVYQV